MQVATLCTLDNTMNIILSRQTYTELLVDTPDICLMYLPECLTYKTNADDNPAINLH